MNLSSVVKNTVDYLENYARLLKKADNIYRFNYGSYNQIIGLKIINTNRLIWILKNNFSKELMTDEFRES